MAGTSNSTANDALKPRPHRALAYHAATLGTFFAASSAPTPLYRLYQQAYAFSPVLIALIFAVYAFSLLVSLLIVGSVSDHLGRRPVIFGALLLLLLAIALFFTANGLGMLIAARIVQGVATGAAASSIGAALIDVDPNRGAVINSLAPLAGMGFGALGASALVQFAPAPMQLVYAILAVVIVILAAVLWRVPETVTPKPGAFSALYPEILVPSQVKRALLSITPINIAVWALGGFYLSLVPSLVGATTGSSAPMVGGCVVAALTVSGGFAVVTLRLRPVVIALRVGISAMTLGLLCVVAGVHLGSVSLLGLGTLIAGAGFGANFLGAVKTIMPLAKPEERAGLLSAFYIESYLAFSLPAIGAGFLAKGLGYVATTDLYAGAIILMMVLGVLALRAGRPKPKGAAA
ncbi:MAG: MFS transporter [Rhizobium sp.]